MAQHLQVVALVGDQQRLEDLLVLVAEVAEADVVRRRERLAAQLVVEDLLAPLGRDEQERVVAQLVDQLGVDHVVVEVGEAVAAPVLPAACPS